ncbi:MAG TPA: hypothetical protein VNG73_11210, partial [Gemmatimonadaceae bacterium]|nr:hypothetical protein [Gemmatimonadaceae bacterium]
PPPPAHRQNHEHNGHQVVDVERHLELHGLVLGEALTAHRTRRLKVMLATSIDQGATFRARLAAADRRRIPAHKVRLNGGTLRRRRRGLEDAVHTYLEAPGRSSTDLRATAAAGVSAGPAVVCRSSHASQSLRRTRMGPRVCRFAPGPTAIRTTGRSPCGAQIR